MWVGACFFFWCFVRFARAVAPSFFFSLAAGRCFRLLAALPAERVGFYGGGRNPDFGSH